MSAGAGMSPGGGMSQSGGMGGLGGGMGGGMGGLGGSPNPNPFSQQFQSNMPYQQMQQNPMQSQQMQPMQQGFDFGAPQAQQMQQAPMSQSQAEGMRGMPQSTSLGAAFQNAQAAQPSRQPQQVPTGLSGLLQQYRQYRY